MTATVVICVIVALLALSFALLFVLPWAVRRAERRRYPWSPFDKNGYVDWRRLKKEGWVQVGTMTEDGIK